RSGAAAVPPETGHFTRVNAPPYARVLPSRWQGRCTRGLAMPAARKVAAAAVAAGVLCAHAVTISAAAEAHGLSQKAVEIARPFGFPITNSMVVTWIVALALIVFAQTATRSMRQVPDGAQNFLEWLVEGLYGFLEGILGRHLVDRTFWFFGSIFIFIL